MFSTKKALTQLHRQSHRCAQYEAVHSERQKTKTEKDCKCEFT